MALSLQSIFSTLKKEAELPPKRVVGIDMGSSSVKVVEIEMTEQAPVLRTYGELQLGPYSNKQIGEVPTLELKQWIEVLVDVMRESGVQATKSVLALPLSTSFATVVPITLKKGEELESKVIPEARKFVPVPLNEVSLEWVELEARKEAPKDLVEVLMVAVQTESHRTYSTVLEGVSMGGEPVELEAFSTMRGVAPATTNSYTIIDIGARTSKFYIVEEGMMQRIHRVTAGGMQISKKLAELRSVSFEEAEIFKRTASSDPTAERDIRTVTKSVLEAPLMEFRRILDQYEVGREKPPLELFLSGGVCSASFMSSYISDVFNRPAQISEPFKKVGYPAFMEDTIKEVGPIFATSIGAALRYFE